MLIKFHYDIHCYYAIDTLLTTVLILIFGIIAHPRYSFLTERLHLNLDKGEVMHNEETI